ncbi:MAG: undecaprenyl/decaprenyl-phosphate alpha-N-acetylglucosaminyl 1-phosphate transferase [Candidatus Levybacteria bacterium]|nr:undecaprenyl/decaprenyl-phosphate alpha-N-acetylglucosaminyl 1-phosphate transferase [Candidatus Levybacteria bacterium]
MIQNITGNIIFAPFFISFIATVIATPLSLILIKRFGIIDDPSKHKHPAIIHKVPIPRGGGIPLFIGVAVGSFMLLPLTNIVWALLFAAFIALSIGVLDDKYDLSPYIRLPVNILCAIIVVASGVSIPFITNPLGGIFYLNSILLPLNIPLSDVVAVVWIVWVMNMLNWSKGVDGQMPGVVAISAIVIGLLSLRFGPFDSLSILSAKLSFIIAGASLGFLVFNFYPAKIFPGYGATAIYLLLAAVSMLSSAKLATAVLVMGVPMIDGVFTISRRVLTGRSPFWHDNKHLHHLLLNFGFGQRHIALFYWIISAILGSLSLLLSSRGKLFALIMVGIIVGGGLLFLHTLNKKNDREEV